MSRASNVILHAGLVHDMHCCGSDSLTRFGFQYLIFMIGILFYLSSCFKVDDKGNIYFSIKD